MKVINYTQRKKEILENFFKVVNSIPEGDDAVITLSISEYNYVLNHLGIRPMSFIDCFTGRVPTYRGIKIYRKALAK